MCSGAIHGISENPSESLISPRGGSNAKSSPSSFIFRWNDIICVTILLISHSAEAWTGDYNGFWVIKLGSKLITRKESSLPSRGILGGRKAGNNTSHGTAQVLGRRQHSPFPPPSFLPVCLPCFPSEQKRHPGALGQCPKHTE